jgi:hypothetical protein
MAQGKKNNIDAEKVLRLAERFWLKSEIAAFFNVHVDTITNNFQDIYEKGRENGKAKIRDLQLNAAYKGNVTMLIWLGKQYLGQTDQPTNNEETGKIIIESDD